ncbi:MAG: hypothetical protein K5895_02135 [Lachnospiraceae bacterium]|nr:hypothetical protein [Lachnospiraceae bacterium]
MATLHSLFYQQKFNNTISPAMSTENIADILLQLTGAASREKSLSPENVDISNDHEIIVLEKKASLYYIAPEILLYNHKTNKDTALYSIGMLLYFMLFGKNYYEVNNELLVMLPEMMQQRNCLIQQIGNSEEYAKYETIIAELTSWESELRAKAIPHILALAMDYPSKAKVKYHAEGNIVFTEVLNISGQQTVIDTSKIVIAEDGKKYQPRETTIIYHRPGCHEVIIEVTNIDVQATDNIITQSIETSNDSSVKSGRIIFHDRNTKLPITICRYNQNEITQKELRLVGGNSRIFVFEAVDEKSGDRNEIANIMIPETPSDSWIFLLVKCNMLEIEITVRNETEKGKLGVLLTESPVRVKI